MEWSVMNAHTGELICGVFADANTARMYLNGDDRIMVHRATNEEDRMHGIGDEWECEHVLLPHECIHCNPDYRHAYWAKCPVCSDGRDSATWHKPLEDEHVQCLKCNHVHDNTASWPEELL